MEAARFFTSAHNEIMKLNHLEVSRVGDDIPLPQFEEETLIKIAEGNLLLFKDDPMLLKLEGEYVVVGDIHGSIYDLLAIFAINGYPPKTRYIFLGDYVDRGDFSLECISFLFSQHILYPDFVILLRGNHEFRDINGQYGFRDSVEIKYPNSGIWESFNNAFEYMPIAAIVNNSHLLVHGGISQALKSLSNIEQIERPVVDFSKKFIDDLLWSDPSENIYMFSDSIDRGHGQNFGNSALRFILDNLNLKDLIRAHQCVDGVESKWKGQCYTVFSHSRYMNKSDNHAGYLKIIGKKVNKRLLPIIKKSNFNQCITYNAKLPKINTNVEKAPGFMSLRGLPAFSRRSAVTTKKTNSSAFRPSSILHLPSLYRSTMRIQDGPRIEL